MGLNVSHGCWSGSYGGFGRFREALATAANIPLPLMYGHYQDALDFVNANGSPIARKIAACIPIQWHTLTPDPIHVLLNHSDCDGIIEHKDLLSLAIRLDMLAVMMRESDGRHDVRDYSDAAETFALGCRHAHKAGECLTFS